MTNVLFEEMILGAAVAKSGGGWMKNPQKYLKCFGWCEIGAKEVEGLSCGGITTMLQVCARRKVDDERSSDMKPKLALLKPLKKEGGESRCLHVADKGQRGMMMMISGAWDSPTQG